MNDTCLIDGFGPLPLVRPASVTELGEIVRRAAVENSALYPVGGGTQLGLGNPPTKPGHAVGIRGLDQIIDFPARDMTVTVQAGIAVGRLQEVLAKENLRLPIDVPQADRTTLGGILASNMSGPRRYGFGTLRDYVIGISAINDEGREFKAGGRVVKNVAGYDLCKLLVGSLGTLGIITQATLKLRPLAEEQALVTLGCDNDRLPGLLDQLHGSRTRPVCLDLLNQSAAEVIFAQAKVGRPVTPWVVVVGYEGNGEAVQWQVEQLIKEVGQANQLEAHVGFTAQPLWNALTEWSAASEPIANFKAGMKPSGLADFCLHADIGQPRLGLHAHAGNGIVMGHLGREGSQDQFAVALGMWRRQVQGFVSVVHCPAIWKTSVNVWGPPSADAWLMREVKAKLDPRGIFNPGRFVAGI